MSKIEFIKSLDLIRDALLVKEEEFKVRGNEKKDDLRNSITNKKSIQKYHGIDNQKRPAWTVSAILFMVVGIAGIAFFCVLEAIAISTLLEYYVPGFAGQNVHWKRIAIGCIAIMVNLSMKYAIDSHESLKLRKFARNLGIICAFLFLSIFFFSFFGEQLLPHFIGEKKTFGFDDNQGLSEVIQIARMIALFCASFAGAYLIGDIPASQLRLRSNLNVVNPDYVLVLNEERRLKSTIADGKKNNKEIRQFLKRAKKRRKRFWKKLVRDAQKDAIRDLEASVS